MGFSRRILMALWAVVFAGARMSAMGDLLVLPPVELVLQRVVTNAAVEAQNDRRFLAHYSFERMKVQEERDRHGVVERRTGRTNVYTPKPLVVAALAAGIEPRPSSNSTYNPTNHQGRAFEKRDFTLNSDLLSRFRFTMVGQETVDDRPMLVLDFSPAGGGAPVHNFKDRFINKAAGRVWVDAGDWIVAKVALRLSEEVAVAGGLVGAVTAFNYQFERERTPDGVWFTRSVDWHLKGREFLARKIIDYHEKRSKVVKMQ
jgi:hypothetical protein